MKITSENFIQQIKAGNEKALRFVIDEYGGLMMAVIRKHLYHMPDKQEECFDDVLLKIWENIASFDPSKNSFKNWAAGVSRYRSIDYLRKYKEELENVSWDQQIVQPQEEDLTETVNDEISEELELMLGCLKTEDRALFMKLYVEEYSIDEISRELQMKKSVVYNRVSRGKKKIRKQALKTGKGFKVYEG